MIRRLSTHAAIAAAVCGPAAAIAAGPEAEPRAPRPEAFWVSPDGDDGNPGSRDAPWRTLGKAGETAEAGDTVFLRHGVYRETLRPRNSGEPGRPIVFRAAPGEAPGISGLDPVTGWTPYAGRVYQAPLGNSLGRNNQVFFNGRPMQEARWPNDADGDPMTPDGAPIAGGGVDSLVCPDLPAHWTADDVAGAVLWAIPQRAWSSWTTTVTGYDPRTRTLFFPSFAGNWWVETQHNPGSGKGTFYLVGSPSFLDAPGEWHLREEDGTLLFRPPGDEDPNRHAVEAKARRTGIDLSDRAWIVVDGIHLLACTLSLERAVHCTVRGMRAQFVSHTRGGDTIMNLNEPSGIHISGNGNILRDSEIVYSAGNGVHLAGHDNAVINCLIHRIGYLGSYASPVQVRGLRNMVSHCTIGDAARDGIHMGGSEHLIQFNRIFRPGRICDDLGAVYMAGHDGGNTVIRHNWIHDNPGNIGIYLDNYIQNYIVHHNVVWNIPTSIRLNRPTGFCMIFHNSVDGVINNAWGPWPGPSTQWGCHVMNNLSQGAITMNREVARQANLEGGAPLEACFDPARERPVPSCPGRGRGIAIAGITGDGPPYIGAYPHSGPAWRPGHDFRNPPDPVYEPPSMPLRNRLRNAAFEYSRAARDAGLDADPMMFWARFGEAEAEVEHHPGFNDPTADARHSVHGNSLKLHGGAGGVEQRVEGLDPGTDYVFSGFVRIEGDLRIELRVASGAGEWLAVSAAGRRPGQAWRHVTARFTTGADDTEVTVSLFKPGPGTVYLDDTGLIPAEWAWPAGGAPAP